MKPLLASALDDLSQLRLPALMSQKLDGVRALVIDGVLMSRNLKPIPNAYLQRMLGRPELNGVDGELLLGDPTDKAAYRKTMAAVMSRDGEPSAVFHVFDHFTEARKPYVDRAVHLHNSIDAAKCASSDTARHLSLLDQKLVETYAEVDALEAEWLDAGHEGAMLRALGGEYKFGRSTVREGILLKLKRFEDAEVIVTGFYEQMRNDNELQQDNLGRAKRTSHKENKVAKGTLGGVEVRILNGRFAGVECQIGTGFTDTERLLIWTNQGVFLGKTGKVKYFPVGCKDKPRFPTFEGWREQGV